MDETVATLLIAAAGGIGTVVTFIIGRRAKAAASDASTAADISTAYEKLVGGMQTRLDTLEIRTASLEECLEVLEEENLELRKARAENEDLVAENEALRKSVASMGKLEEENRSLVLRVSELERQLEELRTEFKNGD